MYRAVVDTNLIVSAIATISTIPYYLFEAWRKGEYILVTSPAIIEEITEVLSRPEKKFSLTGGEIAKVIKTLTDYAFVTSGKLEVRVVKKDADDDKFIAAALEGSASHIVTGDKDLLSVREYQGIKIVTARNFLEKYLRKTEKSLL